MSTTTDRRPAGPPPGGPRHGPMAMGAGMPVQRSMDFRGSLRRLLGVLRPERPRLVAVLVLGVLSVAAAVTGPKLLGQATDVLFSGVVSRALGDVLPAGGTQEQAVEALRAAGQGTFADMVGGMSGVVPGAGVDFTRLGQILLVVLAVYVAAFVFGWLQGRITAHAVQRTVLRMRTDVEAKLSRLPLAYYDRQPRGELLSRVTNDIDNVAQTMQQTLSQLVTSLLTVVGVLAMMFWISPLLAVVALVTVPLSVVVAALIAKRSQPQFVEQWAATGRLNAHIEEMFTGHALVTVFGRQRESAATFAEQNEKLYAASFKAQFISGTIQPALGFISNLNYLVIAVVGGLRVASGAMTLGDVQAFIQYSRQFTQPLTQIASMANLLQSGVASAERVFELLDADEQEPDPAQPATLPQPVQGRVAFEGVHFRYEADVPLIEDLSVVAEPGQTVAIVGPTGAGKTTLVNLLMRFYEVDGGRITLDGVDTRRLTRDDLRGQMGMVLQDTWMYEGSIADNIAYGVDGATREQVVEAAVATHVDRFVRTLPEGYDTVVDDEGGSLSAGEKQLITIARAFLADPAILILDEATSSVDTRTEVLVQHAMNRLRAGRTAFVIAHRLSTIRDADVILVMEHGSIVEKGAHEDLLAADGPYARLYRSQFAAASTPVD
ncbi:ABC transporter ATP-binding protein [Cellulomonas oligotrophica]|uniref:Fatty acid ABC transporter ATP-binding/permease protein n=1 Tax=Cellulomonas oligotrophica TaxID=931536 RepID=A0A7Y9JXQ0_9CELL|nr:ABC transporter ATP-binding protein [Cellulomonas oligotrophica]NYD84949.1 ATP-binding cassette subfamily B protein [Cellulomonas oligotrophica]GIG32019.1 multidrug ABC transporter ATP-binding protein [Cellulomonas oligotrophica]